MYAREALTMQKEAEHDHGKKKRKKEKERLMKNYSAELSMTLAQVNDTTRDMNSR